MKETLERSVQAKRGPLVALFIPFFLLLLCILPIGSSEAPPPSEKPLLLLGDKDYLPITYLERGAAKGLDVDLAKAPFRPPGRETLREAIALTISAFLVLLLGAMALWVMTLKKYIRVRRRAETALRGSEEQFRALMEQAPEGILVFDVDQGRFVETNAKAELLFGRERKDLLAAGPEQFLLPQQPDGRPIRESMREYGERALAGETLVFERAIRNAGGEHRVCEVRLVRLPAPDRRLVRASLIDITKRRQAEAALREAEERYRRFVQMSAEGVWRLDVVPPVPVTLDEQEQAEWILHRARLAECNDALVRAYGYEKAAEMLEARLGPDDVMRGSLEEKLGLIRRFIQSGYRITDLEIPNRDHDGKPIWGLSNNVGIVEGGHLTCIWGTRRDITQRKRTEEALAERTRQLEAVRTVSEEITRELELSTLLALIARRAMDLVGAKTGTLFLWDEATKLLVPHARFGEGEFWGEITLRIGQGLSGTVAQRRTGLIVDDYATSPYALPAVLERARLGPAIAEPLLYQERLLGVIALSNDKEAGRRFSPADQELLRLFANQAAIAIENARLFEAAQHELADRVRAEEAVAARTRQLEAVRTVSEEITREMRLPVLLELIVERAVRLVGAAGGSVMLWDASRSILVPGVWVGRSPAGRDPSHIALDEGVSGTVAAQRRGMIVNDYRRSPLARPLLLERTNVSAVIAEPLLYQDRLVGVIHLDNGETDRRFTEPDQEILRLFTAQAAIAIENARLYEAAQHELADRARAEQHLERSREQLRALSSRLQSLREEERTRIAREIHDHLGQLLTALKMDLRTLDRRMSGLGDTELRTALHSKIRAATELADEMITSVQRIASELRPGILDRLGLAPAIEVEAQGFQSRTGIQCQWSLPTDLVAISPDHATTVFRIFQEILTNVARHAQATQVTVRLSCEEDTLLLQVADDGIGIQEGDIQNPKSLGLLGMQERAAILGGKITFSGRAGTGTTVTVQLPLGEKAGQNQ